MRKRKIKVLIEASGDKYFWVQGGLTLKNLRELRDALAMKAISDEQFTYHVANGKNDFAIWIEEVLEDKRCAERLRRAKNRKGALGVIERTLKQYS